MMKKMISSLLLILLLSSSLLSCKKKEEAPDPTALGAKDFVINGLSITLTEGFTPEVEAGQELLRASTIVAFLDRGDFSTLAGAADLPLLVFARDYGNAVESDGLILLEYSSSGSGEYTYTFFTAFYKGQSAFLALQFACRSELYELYRPFFVTWAKSARPTV